MDPTENMDDGDEIERLMHRFYPLVIESAFGDASLAGVPVAFDLDNPFVQEIIKQRAKTARQIPGTTREEVDAIIAKGTANGDSIEMIQKAIRERGEIASRTRALLIARTETGTVYNLGSIAAYRAGGVTHVDVLDGDDDEPCASANGSRWTLEQAEANPLGHPNCTRAFSPVVE